MVVRMRHTRSHTANRRSHHRLASPALTKDEAGSPHLRHRVSKITGVYRGRQVIDLNKALDKKARKGTATANAR